MSHEISIRNNEMAEMAYVGETPWHGLGQQLQRGAPIEEWIKQAGMDWRVKRAIVRYNAPSADGNSLELRSWEDQHVLFRSDTKAPLGLTSDGYKVVQPAECIEFFRDLVGGFGFELETAGVLKGGRIYWALARINGEVLVAKGDPMRGHVLVSTSCDGSRKTEAANVATRVVCANTLRMSDGETGSRVRVSHRSKFDADSVKRKLGIARESFEEFMANARVLAARKVSDADVAAFMAKVLADKKLAEMSEKETEELAADRAFKAIMKKFMGAGRGAQLDSARGTAWGLVNAVTEFVDHDKPARSQDNRLVSAWFGPGADLKSKALEVGLAMV